MENTNFDTLICVLAAMVFTFGLTFVRFAEEPVCEITAPIAVTCDKPKF